MLSEIVDTPVKTTFAPLDEKSSQIQREQKSIDLFHRMHQGCSRGHDRCVGLMCKMGPSTEDVDVLVNMIVAGMNIAMIKCAEMDGEDHIREVVRKLREANDKVCRILNVMYPMAICMKTVGPELHIGVHEEGEDVTIKLETGSQVTITFDPAYKDKCNRDILYVDLPGDIKVGFKLRALVLLHRGKIKMKVCEVELNQHSAVCDVVHGGAVPSGAVISFPSSNVDLPTISEQDSKNIQLAMELKLDLIILTHTQTGADVKQVRQLLEENKSTMLICASITDMKGFMNADEITKAADAMSVPRGYVERKPVSWNLYLATKTVVAKCRSVGKPMIVTSTFLSKYTGTVEAVLPDVANVLQVVLEGADVFGLGYEVAFGPDPVKCIQAFTEACRQANELLDKDELLDDITNVTLKSTDVMQAISFTAVTLSLRIKAGAFIVITVNGKAACRLSALRPITPIIAVTSKGHVARQLKLFKHVHPIQYCQPRREDPSEDLDARIQFGITYGKWRGFITTGDPLLVIHDREHKDGTKNTITLMFASKVNVV